ncbi:BspA family leucine-rich repeat surface protein [Bifidobacterium sp. ESL0682]|uniref:BspA family leucine-rich repeat surface protein n=1 Tax=Bifidobacterium sp. ESL0682 TaxID=2983212 RepID=UPI0023F61863|nr:BspA family leucine-rich repeat surface protein [Bifidobacterium sp. ESL0682]WEV42012.1 BspA family leucine-rich repeat surface protein [Bifidobacterium sp. ESL0682]
MNLNSFEMQGHTLTLTGTSAKNLFYSSAVQSHPRSIDTSGWNTSQVTDMSNMFHLCYNLTSLDLSNFDTSHVTNMSNMFSDTSLASLDLSNFNTSHVTNMNSMFQDCSNLTSLNLSNFNTSLVTDMSYMFQNTVLTTLDLSNFDTSHVTSDYMRWMLPFALKKLTLGANTIIHDYPDPWLNLGLDDSHWWRKVGDYCTPLSPLQIFAHYPATYIRNDVTVPEDVSCVVFAINPNSPIPLSGNGYGQYGAYMTSAGSGFDSTNTGGTLTVPSASNLVNPQFGILRSTYIYIFTGWNTAPDGTGDSYSSAQKTFTYPQGTKKTITFYAQWKKIAAATFNSMKIHALAGQEPTAEIKMNSPNEFYAGETIRAKNKSYTYTANGGGGIITISGINFDRSTIYNTSIDTSYTDPATGRWVYASVDMNQPIPYAKLSFNAHDGIGTTPNQIQSPIDTDSATVSFAIPETVDLKRPNKEITKWTSNIDGSGASASPGGNLTLDQTQYQPQYDSDHTLVCYVATAYAQWKTLPPNSKVVYSSDNDLIEVSGTALQYNTVKVCLNATYCANASTPGDEISFNLGGDFGVEGAFVDNDDPGHITARGIITDSSDPSFHGGTLTFVACPAGTDYSRISPRLCGYRPQSYQFQEMMGGPGYPGCIDPPNGPGCSNGRTWRWQAETDDNQFAQLGFNPPDTSVPNQPGLYDLYIWSESFNHSQPQLLKANYAYRTNSTAISSWSTYFAIDRFTTVYPVGSQYSISLTVQQENALVDPNTGEMVTTATMEGTLPYTTISFSDNGSNSGNPPDPVKTFTDTSNNNTRVTLPLLKTTDNGGMAKAGALISGWATAAGASEPSYRMGDPDFRRVTAAVTQAETNEHGNAALTLYPVWKAIPVPSISSDGIQRNSSTYKITVNGTAKPSASANGIQVCLKPDPAPDGQCETASWNDSGTPPAWDGSTNHSWTHTYSRSILLDHAGSYTAKAALIVPDRWRETTSTAASLYGSSPSTQINGYYLFALPLTGGRPQRLATLLAFAFGTLLLLLTTATALRDRRRAHRNR